MTTTSSKSKNKERGAIFSIDSLIAFTLTLFILLSFVQTTTNIFLQQKQNTMNFYLEEKTLMIADSLVKNLNEENPLLGSCVKDGDKKRIKSNEIDETLLLQAKSFELKEFFVKELSWKIGATEKRITLSEKESANCLTAKRFALIGSKKGVIEVKGCLTDEN